MFSCTSFENDFSFRKGIFGLRLLGLTEYKSDKTSLSFEVGKLPLWIAKVLAIKLVPFFPKIFTCLSLL